jgi:hypothetical protein
MPQPLFLVADDRQAFRAEVRRTRSSASYDALRAAGLQESLLQVSVPPEFNAGSIR